MAKKFLMLALLLAGCFSRSSMMTYAGYDGVDTGMPIEEVKERMGEPYKVHTTKGGVTEYEYVERMNAGDNLMGENHYFLIVEEGKVVGKYMTRERMPPYDLIYQDQPNYPGNQ
jgi:hypothetical protein